MPSEKILCWAMSEYDQVYCGLVYSLYNFEWVPAHHTVRLKLVASNASILILGMLGGALNFTLALGPGNGKSALDNMVHRVKANRYVTFTCSCIRIEVIFILITF